MSQQLDLKCHALWAAKLSDTVLKYLARVEPTYNICLEF